jgi:hypothetical protein
LNMEQIKIWVGWFWKLKEVVGWLPIFATVCITLGLALAPVYISPDASGFSRWLLRENVDLMPLAPIGLLIYFAFRHAAIYGDPREKELTALAAELGLKFVYECNYPLTPAPHYLPFMAAEGSREAEDIMLGRIGDIDVTMCELSAILSRGTAPLGNVAPGTGKVRKVLDSMEAEERNRPGSMFTVVLGSALHYQNLIIWPESIKGFLPESTGLTNVDFESSEFNRTFFVASDDKRFAFDVVHPRMMELLMTHPTWGVELAEHTLTAWTLDYLPPRKYGEGLEFAMSLQQLLPEYLKEELSNPGRVE